MDGMGTNGRQGARRLRSIGERALLSALVVGLLGGAASFGILAAFSATTSNSGNEITAGNVQLADNDSGAALYNITGLKPGESVSRCIRVSYIGSLPASVRLYASGAPGVLAPYVDVTVTEGTQPSTAFPSCTGFVADAGGQRFSGTLQAFEQTNTDYASGIATAPATWSPGAERVYRVVATLRSTTPDSAQGASTGAHSFVWEARNT